MINRPIFLFVATVMVLGWTSCQTERDPCLQPTQISTQIEVVQAVETDTGILIKDSTLPAPIYGAIDSVQPFGIPGQRVNPLVIRFSPLTDSTQIFVIPDSSNKNLNVDTLTFRYQRILNFISTACGYNYFYTIRSVSVTPNANGAIDSVQVVNGDVTDNTSVINVKIFY